MTATGLAIVTVCSNHYVPAAKVMMRSARLHHPHATLYLCLGDHRVDEPGFYPEDCEVIDAASLGTTGLGIAGFNSLAFGYDAMELNTAMKPFILLEALNRGHDRVMYFDTDIALYSPLDDILDRLDGGASMVVTPHVIRPAEGAREPDDLGIMRAGVYNTGFLAVRDCAEARGVLEWWGRRLLRHCLKAQESGLFVDQKFFDLVPCFGDAIHILRRTRHNVAYWNLQERSLTQEGEGWRVDGAPLGFFHFSGLDPSDPSRLSRYDDGAAVAPVVAGLVTGYAAALLAEGHVAARRHAYGYGRFASGAPIPRAARQLFRTAYADFADDPFRAFEPVARRIPAGRRALYAQGDAAPRVAEMQGSASWRLTEPLRLAMRLMGRVLAPYRQALSSASK